MQSKERIVVSQISKRIERALIHAKVFELSVSTVKACRTTWYYISAANLPAALPGHLYAAVRHSSLWASSSETLQALSAVLSQTGPCTVFPLVASRLLVQAIKTNERSSGQKFGVL